MRHKIGQWDCKGGRAGEGKRVLECTLKIEPQKEGEGGRKQAAARELGGGGNRRNSVGGHERNFTGSAAGRNTRETHLNNVICLKIRL